MIHPERINSLNHNHDINGPVVYWMSRDQRINHNWALLFAEQLALENHQTLIVAFNLVLSCPDATLRHYDFMLKGLMQTEQKFEALNIPFFILAGAPEAEIPRFITTYKAGAVVSDFSPLKISRAWKKRFLKALRHPVTKSMPTTSSPAVLHRTRWNFPPEPSVLKSTTSSIRF